jgi:hypothetical protein
MNYLQKTLLVFYYYFYIAHSTPRPIMAEALDQKDELGGLPEKFIIRTPEMAKYVLSINYAIRSCNWL